MTKEVKFYFILPKNRLFGNFKNFGTENCPWAKGVLYVFSCQGESLICDLQSFIRKMISMIAEPEKYQTVEGKPIKDSFYVQK